MISFRVYGIPQTKGSAKAFYRPGMRFPVVTNDNPRNKPWSQTVSAVAQQHRPSAGLYQGPVRVTLIFYMPIPKSLPKRGPAFMTKRPDLDKCTRSILDAIKGVIYADDSQVVGLEIAKLYGLDPGVQVTVEQIDEAHHRVGTYVYHPAGRIVRPNAVSPVLPSGSTPSSSTSFDSYLLHLTADLQ